MCRPHITLSQEAVVAAARAAPAELPGYIHAALCGAPCPGLTGVGRFRGLEDEAEGTPSHQEIQGCC